MSTKFKSTKQPMSEREVLRQATRRLLVAARQLDEAIAAETPLPPGWVQAAIVKASMGMWRAAQIVGSTAKPKAALEK